jgi:hypothetical protein
MKNYINVFCETQIYDNNNLIGLNIIIMIKNIPF